MPFSSMDILYGGIIPVAVSAVVMLILRAVLPQRIAERYSASVAIVAGFLVGYGLLSYFSDLAPGVPSAHWHWFPYAVVGAAIIGPLGPLISPLERPSLYIVPAVAAAYLLVPNWEDLEPSRLVYIILMSSCLVVLASTLESINHRVRGPLLPAMLWATMTATAVILALSGSLRFAQIAGCGAGALFGCLLMACVVRDRRLMGGSALMFAIMTLGLLLIGQVHSFSEIPAISYALVALSPLVLSLGWLPHVAKLSGGKSAAFLVPLALAPIVIGLTIALVAEFAGSGGKY